MIRISIVSHSGAEIDMLIEREKRLKYLFEHFPHGLAFFDNNTILIEANEKLLSILDVHPSDYIGKGIKEIALQLGLNADIVYADFLHRLNPEHKGESEFTFKKTNGKNISVSIKSSVLKDKNEICGVHYVLEDVTEQKKAVFEKSQLQEQLNQIQKMDVIRNLAGGIAHDFNNMLTVIIGSANSLLMNLRHDDPDRMEYTGIMDAAARAKMLTMKLLTFAHKDKPAYKTISIHTIINELVPVLDRIFLKKIRIETFAPDDMLIKVDLSQIQQALLNLCTNSYEAMPNGGIITIECNQVVFDESTEIRNRGLNPGSYCWIRVEDTGIGMSQNTLVRAFEPFFSGTKTSPSSGLGLSVTHGIVSRHGGDIYIDSEIGKGTTVHVYLPIYTENESVTEEGLNSVEDISVGDGTEKILIVDDEKSVLYLLENILRDTGYVPLTADCGMKAVEVFRRNCDDISLVLLDIMMPEMDGFRVLDEFSHIKPDINAIMISGYARGASAISHIGEKGTVDYVQKPFTIATLCNAIRRVLDSGINNIPKKASAISKDEMNKEETVNKTGPQNSDSKGDRAVSPGNNNLTSSHSLSRTHPEYKDGNPIELEISKKLKQNEHDLNDYDTKEKLRNLSRQLISSYEQERALLAQNIHDDIGQKLSALSVEIEWLKGRSNNDRQEFDRVSTLADDLTLEIWRICRGLHPVVLRKLGISEAIEANIESLGNRVEMNIESFVNDISLNELHPDVSLCLYRAYQELVNNSLKHSGADNIFVSLKKKGADVELKVRDDGIGVSHATIEESSGLGIRGLKERVANFGGNLDIESQPGSGSCVTVIIEKCLNGREAAYD